MPRKMLLALAVGILLTPLSAAAQQNTTITGVIRSNAQAPVAGAFVAIPSLNLTQITNDYGQYRFVIPAAQVTGQQVTIEARSIGYSNAEVRVTLRAGSITQNITMAIRAVQLDEVVVTGTAGRTERRAQSAVVSSIDAARVAEVAPVTSVAGLLQSRTPGVVLRQQSGTTGTYSQIRIRGVSSISLSNEPLIYIDGIRVAGGDQQIYGTGNQQGSRLNDIKIEDIESMDVVKGPAAATLYGSDAVAGVINIITKKGRAGSGFVQTINAEYGEGTPNFEQPANFGICSAFALARPTTYPACVGQPEGTILSDRPLSRDKSFGNARYRNMNYSMSGGGDKYGAYFSLGANGDEGTVPNSFYGQVNSRASFDYLIRENLHAEFNFGMIRVNTKLPRNDNDIYGFLGGGMLGDPRTIGAAKDGWYAQRQTLAISSVENSNLTSRFQPRGAVSYSPAPWFTNKLTIGADMMRTEASIFWAKNDQGWWDNGPQNNGQISEARRAEDRYTLEYIGTVRRSFTEDLRLDFAAGAQAMSRRTDQTDATGQGLVNNDVRSVDAAALLLNGGQESSASRDIGVFSQADISWRERVYVQLGLRRDQSSSFGADSKPFYLPKIGVSYVISDEPYFQNAMSFLPEGAITQLRLRTAYGVSGRQPTSGARSTYNPSTNLVNNVLIVGVRPGATGNPLLSAEKSQELELGLDGGFLNDRLSLELTYFHKKGIDQILELPVPGSLGADGPDVNVGALLNTGFEIASEARILTKNNVAWQVRGSVSTLKNELLDLGGVPESATRRVGFPLNGEWDEPIISVDLENNRVIVGDSAKFLGNGSNYPGWDAALSSTLTLFRNLSFYAQVDGRGDRLVFDGTNEFRDRQFGQGEAAVRGAAAFGTEADGVTPTEEARIMYLRRFGPFYNESGTLLNRGTIRGDYLQDGTFFRLREASVNYSIPNSFVRKYVRARSATVGITMRNLATWTDFTGLDPETDQFLTVPQDRRWTARVLFTF